MPLNTETLLFSVICTRFRGDFIFQQREAVSRAIYLPYASRCPQKPPIVLPTIEEFKERYYDEIFRNAAPGSNTSLGVHTGLVRMESRLALSHVESRTLLNDFSTYDLQDNFFSGWRILCVCFCCMILI